MLPGRRARRQVIPHSNRSPYGWWIASYIERFERYDEPKRKLRRRCLAWENTILVRARDRGTAYRKATAHARLGDGSEARDSTGRLGAWRSEGLTMLLPIYERLEDGAEVLWKEHSGRTVKSIRSLVRSKHHLAVFDDSEPNGRDKRRSNEPLERAGVRASRQRKHAGAGRSAPSR